MVISEETRSGNKDVDRYIEALESEVSKYNGESNTTKLIRSIDGMAGNISEKLNLMNEGKTNGDGTEVELSGKFIDSFIKMVEKADKIEAFSKLANSLYNDTTVETTTTTEIKSEKRITGKNAFEETLAKIKGGK